MPTKAYNYGTAILSAFEYLLENYPEVFVIGQGLWSPWYVGNSMTDLDKKFGIERVIDTPVSESACTGAAVGASLAGMKPIVVHPRMDFMLYAMDAVVNQAAKWSHMLGGQAILVLPFDQLLTVVGSKVRNIHRLCMLGLHMCQGFEWSCPQRWQMHETC
ncbi:Pyruvate dehydrogenase E1 component beta subunit (EC [uncultured Gammaproteobacteria bacterium]|nr:Pyruvate dehydrogenase E1 component beta subunit (EC [uncultured Gammaproteobacteria bacterium]